MTPGAPNDSITQEGVGIDLALSGGGVRAMAFHAGVLKYLAEHALLEHVRHISSVSGGSLLIGLLLQKSAMCWPSSSDYLVHTLPAVRHQLTTYDLQSAAFGLLLLPWNWRHITSRANVLAHAIERHWGVRATLAALPSKPVWSINGTTAETGRRFRFKSSGCGDYQLGYADAATFPLAHALAVSAAFPGAIGPLAIRCENYRWKKRPEWNSPVGTETAVQLPYQKLHLYDAGLYDNLGLEPLFDIGTQRPKAPGGWLLVSDAGAPLIAGFTSGAFNPLRMKRWFDLATEQQRSLRLRSVVNALREGMPGAYLQIGSSRPGLPSAEEPSSWLSAEQSLAAARCATSLRRMSRDTFDLLLRHGYETAHWNDLRFPYSGASRIARERLSV